MARLDVYPMPGNGVQGYILDVQADLLNQLNTRTVVPLIPQDHTPQPIRELNPVFNINGKPHVMLTQAIASIPAKELRHAIMSLDMRHDQITRALDILLLGF